MLSLILSLLKNSSIRNALIAVLLIGALALGGCFLYNHIYDKGKDAGIAYQTQIYNKQQEEAKAFLAKEQEKADQERSDLNQSLSTLKDENSKLQTALNKKYSAQTQKVTDYAKTNDGTKSCFDSDSDGMRIINDSFPDSN